ncbi:kelch repeat and BTB domain-containing protein 11 [Ambystoma mexicanum]|uniref:kelch repeat and BTB domain-containing protein 11 n=1 Tax=Ambystoma mexicanum TaxID=8296 RepID=UPI0037E89A7D
MENTVTIAAYEGDAHSNEGTPVVPQKGMRALDLAQGGLTRDAESSSSSSTTLHSSCMDSPEFEGNLDFSSNGELGEEGEFHIQSPCSLSSSLCFSSELREDSAGTGRDGGRVVENQWEINNASTTSELGNGESPPHVANCGQAGAGPWSGRQTYRVGEDGGTGSELRGKEGTMSAEHWGNGKVEKPDCAEEAAPDLVIEVAGRRIQAHKPVLAEKSDYFRARSSRDILRIKGLSYSTLKLLIDYIYTSRLEVTLETVVEVIAGAQFLQMPCAVQCATDNMRAQITLANCYQVLNIAKRQRLSELREATYRFMSDNFLQVLRDPAVYGRLSGVERDLILRRRTEGREQRLLVAEMSDAFERLNSYGSSRPQSRESSRPQSPASTVSTSSTEEECRFIYTYNEQMRSWRPLTQIPDEANAKGCSACVLYNYFFIAGGIRGQGDRARQSDKVFCYNPATGEWSQVRSLSQPRAQLKLLALDGYLYAVGGECLFSVERYDPRTDRWTSVAPLPKGAFAVAHEAVTCAGEIYVSGGSLFYRLLKYDPRRNFWEECPYNNSRRRSADMVAVKGFIYRFDLSRNEGVNVFKYNAVARRWSDCASLQKSGGDSPNGSGSTLQPFRCTALGSVIYCVNRASVLRFCLGPESRDGGYTGAFDTVCIKPPPDAKGVLFPCVLSLPEKIESKREELA